MLPLQDSSSLHPPACAAASASPLPGPASDPGAADRGGAHPSAGPTPSALGYSVAGQPSPPPLWDISGQELGSLLSLLGPTPGPGEPPRQELGRLPHRGAGLGPLWELPLLPQPYEAEEALSAPGVGDSTGRGARAEWPTCTPSWACALGRALR